jgi:hypothetical protein
METDLADQEYATEVVSYLLSSFPQQAPDPVVYGSQLIALCVGRRKALLRLMVNPVEGILGTSEFLPPVATVKAWLDRHSGPTAAERALRGVRLTLEARKETEEWQESREDNEARVARARAAMASIRQATKAKELQIQQVHNPEKLRAALASLEAMNTGEPQ